MRAADLDLNGLLEFKPKGGVIQFAGQRAVILDTVALGLLRKELIDTIGATAAKGVLTRLGYAHGWRTAETLRHALPWDSDQEWRAAGGRLHGLQGLVEFESVDHAGQASPPFADAIWKDSYEAEQHLLHFGRSDEPVCWTLCGFASGYLSHVNAREIYCAEDRCAGRGDAACRMVGRPRDEWGDRLPSVLAAYERSLDATLCKVTDALRRAERELRVRSKAIARLSGESEEPAGMVARSEAMRRVLALARRVAKVDSTVLVTGESGAGKERVARLIHDDSARASGPFVGINCGALPESLLESELFGHAKGAFTGATQDRPGLFESANRGTLFLDEIGEIPPPMQVKLLRVLQEREVRRVGENRNRPIDVRVVAATNRDLAADVDAKSFRQDLYYRLRVVELKVPPLRERREDILPLARSFLARCAERTGHKVDGISPSASARLFRYEWPGNVRELENAIEHAVALATESRIEAEDLPEEIGSPRARTRRGIALAMAEVEREHILSLLASNRGNRKKTAAQLELGETTLYRKLREYERRGFVVPQPSAGLQ